jgi:hypothetical protein
MRITIKKIQEGHKSMVHDYKVVIIYADALNNLYIIPNSEKEMVGVVGGAIAEMDVVNYIAYPYTEEILEETVFSTFEQCHTEVPQWPNGLGPMEQFLNIKGYARAVKGKRYVELCWDIDEGYSVIPTNKIKRQGYIHQVEQKIALGKTIKKGKLATAIKIALSLSITY